MKIVIKITLCENNTKHNTKSTFFMKISPKITDLELETNEFHHDPVLKMCFLQVIFDTNEIVFNVIPFALLSIVVGGKYSELFQNFPFFVTQ